MTPTERRKPERRKATGIAHTNGPARSSEGRPIPIDADCSEAREMETAACYVLKEGDRYLTMLAIADEALRTTAALRGGSDV